MSAAFYNRMASVATRLLTKFGATVTVSRTTGETYDEIAETMSGGSVTTYSPKGLLVEYDDSLIDGTRIQKGDKMAILDNTVKPASDDLLTVDEEQWNVVRWKTIKPSTVAVVYFVQVRK